MLALSPPIFSTTYGWQSENITPQNLQDLQQDCNDISTEFEANSYNLFQDSHTYNQIQHEYSPEYSISTSDNGSAKENIGEPLKVTKNLNHNASERDRRKRVNELYAFLRSLLPMSTDQKKKGSIPQTVSRALEYIPKLQKEVETLISKKEKLLAKDHVCIKKPSANIKSSVVSSVSVLGENDVVIQLIFSTEHMSKNKDVGFLSKILEYFENDEDGFVLLNSTTFIGSVQQMSLNTLHLQAQGDKKIDVERLKGKLCSFYQQSD